MIVLVEGRVVKKEPTKLVIQTQCGIGYEVSISINTYNSINSEQICLHTVQIIRDDAHLLFGFFSEDEKFMFSKLVKVNGVGPSTALAVCSTFTPGGFFEAISSNDFIAITSVPGIGPKSAKRLLVELSDFSPLSGELEKSSNAEAFMALESLGFKKDKIKKVLLTCKQSETSALIKEALKKI